MHVTLKYYAFRLAHFSHLPISSDIWLNTLKGFIEWMDYPSGGKRRRGQRPTPIVYGSLLTNEEWDYARLLSFNCGSVVCLEVFWDLGLAKISR